MGFGFGAGWSASFGIYGYPYGYAYPYRYAVPYPAAYPSPYGYGYPPYGATVVTYYAERPGVPRSVSLRQPGIVGSASAGGSVGLRHPLAQGQLLPDAEILIDGEPWDCANGDSRFTIDVAAGRHQLEVRREGYGAYVQDD